MSYDINLCDPVTHDVLELDDTHYMRGGTYAMGGTTLCTLNATYNYAPIFRRELGEKGIRTIYGMTGAESIPVLEAAASRLADDATGNYWDETDGNVKRALLQLVALAKLRPDGVWDGD